MVTLLDKIMEIQNQGYCVTFKEIPPPGLLKSRWYEISVHNENGGASYDYQMDYFKKPECLLIQLLDDLVDNMNKR